MERHRLLADGALVINLDRRPERWGQTEREVVPALAPRLGVLERLAAVDGVELSGFGRPPYFRGRRRDRSWAGRAGCVLSHRNALERAAAARWSRVLVLEDDITLSPAFDAVLPGLLTALDSVPWDLCYLGFTSPVGPFRTVRPLAGGHALKQLQGCNCTHAYLVRAAVLPALLAALPTSGRIWPWLSRHRAVDRWYRRQLSRRFRVLAVSPSLILQRPAHSDITQRDSEAPHRTAIDAADAGTLAYVCGRAVRHALDTASGLWDSLRALHKRLNGF